MMQTMPPLRDGQEEAPAAECGRCGGGVYAGEYLVRWEGRALCPDCFRAKLLRWLRDSPAQVAERLGFQYEEVRK